MPPEQLRPSGFRRSGIAEQVARGLLWCANYLVIGDNRTALLCRCGYKCVLFPSAEAFESHRDFEQAVCVILDINLDDGSGIELRHRLTTDKVSAPVIYMTENDGPAVRAEQ